jgi:hypothetical protein
MHLTQSTINVVIWTAGLALQCALVVVVFRRGIARCFPAFTVLITFYPLRAALLFALVARLEPGTYESLYNGLALLALFLQGAVDVEITLRLIRELGGWSLRRGLLLLGLVSAASVFTWLMLSRLPSHAPIPTDRTETLACFVMLSLFAWVLAVSHSKLLLRIVAGFALFAAIQLLSQVARAEAALQRNDRAYAGWSYALAGTYLIVVAMWLVALRSELETKNNGMGRENG